MIAILKTSRKYIDSVVANRKHALDGEPMRLSLGDLILISELASPRRRGVPRIKFVMEYGGTRRDTSGVESRAIWGRTWPYIIDGKSCRPLRTPFNIRDVQTSNKNYGQGGTLVYVEPQDEQEIRKRRLLD